MGTKRIESMHRRLTLIINWLCDDEEQNNQIIALFGVKIKDGAAQHQLNFDILRKSIKRLSTKTPLYRCWVLNATERLIIVRMWVDV